MPKTRVFSVGALLVVLTLNASAAVLEYHGDVSPDTDNSAGVGCSFFVREGAKIGSVVADADAIDGFAWQIDDQVGDSGDPSSWIVWESQLNGGGAALDIQSAGATLVARLRMEQSVNPAAMLLINDQDAGTGNSSKIAWGGAGPSLAGRVKEFDRGDITSNDTGLRGEYVIVRLTVGDLDGVRVVNVYVNEEPTPVLTIEDAAARNRWTDSVGFGIQGRSGRGLIHFDWITATDAGAFSPGYEVPVIGRSLNLGGGPACAAVVTPIETQTATAEYGQPATPDQFDYMVYNAGSASLEYSVTTCDAQGDPMAYTWLSAGGPPSSLLPGDSAPAVAEITDTSLSPGVHVGYISVTPECDPDARQIRTIELTVTGCEMSVGPEMPIFRGIGSDSDAVADAVFRVENTGAQALVYTVTEVEDVPWLSFAEPSGALSPGQHADVTGQIDPADLSPGIHTAVVEIVDNCYPQGTYRNEIRLIYTEGSKPNFLFLLVDDLRYNGAGAFGHPFANTPGIDRLADEGIRFTNAFVNSPLCGPSRHCFLTGRYGRTTGAQSNGTTIDWSAHPTFARRLQDAGYTTAFIGKSHLGNHGRPVPGFDYWAGFPSQGVYFGTPSEPIEMLVSWDGETYETETYTNNEYNTDVLTDYASEWIENLGAGGSVPPFCMCLWYKAVHDPRTPATRHANLYAGEDFAPMTPAMTDPVAEGKPDIIRNMILSWNQKTPSQKQDIVNGIALKDIRTLQAVDESVETMLATLQSVGVLDNTVVVFTSDNGYFFRDFGLGDKRWQHDPSIRIPWVVRYPPMVTGGTTSDLPIMNTDLAPTFLDLAGAEIPDDLPGRSLRPILEGTVAEWRTEWFTEYFQEAVWDHPSMDAVSKEIDGNRYKYIHYPHSVAECELYDLTGDPYELVNVIGEPDFQEVLATLQSSRSAIVMDLTPVIPNAPYITLDTFRHDRGLVFAGNVQSQSTGVHVGGRDAAQNLGLYLCFAARDEWTYRGDRPVIDVTVSYYDGATGSFRLQYDSSDFAYTNEGKYKAHPDNVILEGTSTWRQHTFHVTDAYFGNRQNAGADFRLSLGGDTIAFDRVTISDPTAVWADLDHDGDVDVADLAKLQQCVGVDLATSPTCVQADLDSGGDCDAADLLIFEMDMGGPQP